ncbi:SGNH/GDSL hydrolase family protein [Nocardia stercoris]|uniref:SGNH/GDSL hydrolase family protein n=1 Tax=Nocardia stercoris TaxID=2483361 RepID=A0A3M2KWJ8_9NOCA|nr:SGNH/GDSL hydrolase family protein [Nocardia stercoris]RMI29957.1 SGNH/GDSL hydrolase family protein [Nocardia stercoris]
MRFPRSAALAGALPIAAGILLTGAATAAPASVNYAALGDSYSAGVGGGDYLMASGDCQRSPNSYAQLWADSHHPASFDFEACSGATTADVIANQLGGLNANTSLVTITIGGNDVGFADVIETCSIWSQATCLDAIAQADAQVSTTLAGKLDKAYAAIKAHAPNARLVVLGYPHVETSDAEAYCWIYADSRAALNAAADHIDAVIQARATAAGATYVDTRPYFAGHEVCTDVPWIHTVDAATSDSYHPTADGYAYADYPALVSVTG